MFYSSGGVMAQLSPLGYPWGVCLMGDGKAAVALHNVKKIQFIHVVGDSLSLDRSIDVKGSLQYISI